MLKIEHLSTSYKTIDGDVHVINDLDLTIKDNEIFGIAGESGCGKTTLLNTLYDIVEFPLVIDQGRVVLEGENMGALIGHRGETLDAIQQLTGYAVNKGRSHRVRIHVDAEGYRARREESLNRLARKTAGKVVKYRRNITLEAMNAYERHVIHTALQDYPGVSTFSTGTEPNRRTVVAYDPNKQ